MQLQCDIQYLATVWDLVYSHSVMFCMQLQYDVLRVAIVGFRMKLQCGFLNATAM